MYLKLGQLSYFHKIDGWRQLYIQRGEFGGGDKYIYFGQNKGFLQQWGGTGI